MTSHEPRIAPCFQRLASTGSLACRGLARSSLYLVSDAGGMTRRESMEPPDEDERSDYQEQDPGGQGHEQ